MNAEVDSEVADSAALAEAVPAAAVPAEIFEGRELKLAFDGIFSKNNRRMETMKKGLWIALGVVGAIVLGLLAVGNSYVSAKNQMVAYDQDVQDSFSAIDVDMQRRSDLIPNLVATVKGYAAVEENILTAIANARAGLMTAKTPDEKLAANDRLNVAILPLMRMQESYPQLKSNEQFMRLEDELSGTENRIAVSRLRYNDKIKTYNVFIQQFPNSIWANFAGFHTRNQYYSADDAAKTAPKVDFSNPTSNTTTK
jgi:LemA protein